VTPGLTSLVKKIDAATAKNSKAKMGSFVVFCTDDDKLEDKLKELAEKEKISKCVLTIDQPAGPRGFKIAKEADITVVLYNKKKVMANHAFEKGKMTDKDIEAVVADLAKILPESK
jgi:hypothetical protein